MRWDTILGSAVAVPTGLPHRTTPASNCSSSHGLYIDPPTFARGFSKLGFSLFVRPPCFRPLPMFQTALLLPSQSAAGDTPSERPKDYALELPSPEQILESKQERNCQWASRSPGSALLPVFGGGFPYQNRLQ